MHSLSVVAIVDWVLTSHLLIHGDDVHNRMFMCWSLDYHKEHEDLQNFSVCLFVYLFGVPESPLPLNLGQGSDSPGTIMATCSTSVRGQRAHVPGPAIQLSMSNTFGT